MRRIWSTVTALVRFMASGLNTGEGDRPGSPVPAATAPAWPIWAETAAPSACTASASRARPGVTSGVRTSSFGVPQPSGATAQ